MQNFLEKFKSWPMWVALGALVVFCVKQFAGIDISDSVNGLLDVLLPVLIAFGVINNPNSRNSI